MNIKSGQSLVEVLVAVTMGVMLLSALVIATTKSIKTSRHARAQAEATHLAKEKIEELRNTRDEEGWDALLGVSREDTISMGGTSFSREVNFDNAPALGDTAEIRVTVSWEGTHQVTQKTTLTKWAY